MVAPATSPELYALFERAIRAASVLQPPTQHDIRVTSERRNGSTFQHYVTLDRETRYGPTYDIPWGVIDGINTVTWYPVPYTDFRGPRVDTRSVTMSCSGFNGGIMVRSDWAQSNYPLCSIAYQTVTRIFGVAGTIERLADCVALPSEDAVVAEVVKTIQDAYASYDDECNARRDDEEYGGEPDYDRMYEEAEY